ncbi:unannotated protein [freshwater metagenome]|uniref:Unannotated protein n=1 Tax=freshwater metagenome TaxID=449393 RepID=A0A6J7E5U3_9ZZZZ
MDYTVFLLASAKEHYERSGDPHEAMVGAVAHSGRVIFAAGAVMVAVFFFAMIFAISMDYTVFLLSSAKEHWDRSHNAREAMVGSVAHSGRVIFAAAAVMVAVFFTFALSGPLPPKEMGVILGVAVLLDAFLVRLLLMPVLLRLLGARAWWLPAPLRRILPDVRFGHA